MRNAATAMALLPFLAAGYSHEEGPYQEQVAAGLKFLITHMGNDGSLWEQGGTMYSHGIATTALCDAFNLSSEKPTAPEESNYAPAAPAAPEKRDAKSEKLARAEAAKAAKAARAEAAKARCAPPDGKGAVVAAPPGSSAGDKPPQDPRAIKQRRTLQLGIAAQKALDFIVAAQSSTSGGWRYLPGQEGDTSVVGWQLMALKAGVLAKLNVPKSTITNAGGFLDSVQGDYGSSYGYTTPARGTPSTTAIGLLARENMGWDPSTPALARGAKTWPPWVRHTTICTTIFTPARCCGTIRVRSGRRSTRYCATIW